MKQAEIKQADIKQADVGMQRHEKGRQLKGYSLKVPMKSKSHPSNPLNLRLVAPPSPKISRASPLRPSHIRTKKVHLRIAIFTRNQLRIPWANRSRNTDLPAIMLYPIPRPRMADGEIVRRSVVIGSDFAVAETHNVHIDRGVLLPAGDAVGPVLDEEVVWESPLGGVGADGDGGDEWDVGCQSHVKVGGELHCGVPVFV